jgi:RNA polymerase sigma factor (sigma-70 family)
MGARATTATGYIGHRQHVLGILGRRCPWLDEGDRENVFHDAYAIMLEKERDGTLDTAGMHPAQVSAYLVQTALHRALDEGRRAWRRRSVPLDVDEDAYADNDAAPLEDLVKDEGDRARIAEIVAELPERQQAIIKLRFFFDRAPAEIQRFLGLTERVYRRELERAMNHIGDRFSLVLRGDFCESRRSVILAYVAGIAGPTRALDARRHLATCRGCAQWAGELRTAAEGLAAVLPLPPMTRLFEPHIGLWERGMAALHDAKQTLLGWALRDGTTAVAPAGGARPGAVAAVVAVAIAGGGSVIAVPATREAVKDAISRDDPREPRRVAATATPRPVMTVAPTATPPPAAPAATPTPEDRARTERREQRRAAERERRREEREAAAGVPLSPADQAASTQEFGAESATAPAATPPPAPPSASANEFGP